METQLWGKQSISCSKTLLGSSEASGSVPQGALESWYVDDQLSPSDSPTAQPKSY